MGDQPEVESWEEHQVEVGIAELKIHEGSSGDGQATNGDVLENGESSTENTSDIATTAETGDANVSNLVDHALRDALARPKHRSSVLKLEAEIEEFVLNSTDAQHMFSGDMTSYERLLTHRTAQHWGLDTSTLSQGPDQGRIIATRTPHAAQPSIKLSDVPVTMVENTNNQQSSAPAPSRVLVRKRGEKTGTGNGGSYHHHHNNNHHQQHHHSRHGGDGGGYPPIVRGSNSSVEEREQNYERARARIFSDGQQQQQQQHHHQQQQQRSPHAGGNMRHQQQAMFAPMPMHYNQPQYPAVVRSSGGNGNGNNRKAQLRNRQEDLSDPDFRRGRHGPRFDPGYGEDLPYHYGSMYIHPSYTSDFPDLPSGPVAGTNLPTSPSSASSRGSAMHQHQHAMYAPHYPATAGAAAGGHVAHQYHHPHPHHPSALMAPAGHYAQYTTPGVMTPAGMVPMQTVQGPTMMAYGTAGNGMGYVQVPYGYMPVATAAATPGGGGGVPGQGQAIAVPMYHSGMPYGMQAIQMASPASPSGGGHIQMHRGGGKHNHGYSTRDSGHVRPTRNSGNSNAAGGQHSSRDSVVTTPRSESAATTPAVVAEESKNAA